MGQLRESRTHFEQAMVLLGHPMPTAERGWGLAVLRNIARQALHRFLPFAVVESSPQKRLVLSEAASTMGRLGQVYYFGEEKVPVLATALTDVNLSERSGFPTELARGYATTALICGNIPLHKLAAFYRAMAEETVPKADKLSTKAYVLEVIGVSNMGVGRWAEAVNALEQSAELLGRLELRRWGDEARLLLALIAYHRGQFVYSTQRFGEALASARHRNDALAQFWALLGLAECALRLGGIHASNMMFFLEDAKRLPEKYLGRAEMIRRKGVLALLYLHQGNEEQARQEAHQAARMIKESNFWMLWSIEGYAAPAEVFLTLWEKCTSPTEAKTLAQLAHEGCKAIHEFARILTPGQPRAWLYQGLLHWLKGEKSRASQCWYKSLAAAEQLMMPYEEGRAHYEIGRHLPAGDPDGQQHLARAEEIFTQLECAALTTGRATT
jgi:tetratricopeptide (TPR) repeat protein